MNIQSIKPLQERAKELQCLYAVESILKDRDLTHEEAFNKLVKAIPEGWQIPEFCHAIISYEDKIFYNDEQKVTDLNLTAEIVVDNTIVGSVTVFYKELPYQKEVFLAEEQKLLNNIANRISQFIFYDKLEKTVDVLSEKVDRKDKKNLLNEYKDEYWKWRFNMAEKIASCTDFNYYGIRALYLIGSTKEATAGPASDIDLLVHFTGDKFQEKLLRSWMSGWSYALNENNFEKTGYDDAEGLIDLHIITDDDIKKKTSFAVMIGNINNPARLLKKIE